MKHRVIWTATAAALFIAGSQSVAFGANSDESEVSPASHAVASSTATASWSTERMLAATPLDVHTAPAVESTGDDVEIGDPLTIQAVSPSKGGEQEPVGALSQMETPVSHIGKLFFTFQGNDSTCSANSVVSANESVIATAAHCLTDGEGTYVENIVFVPAFEHGYAPYGQWEVTETFMPTEYSEGGNHTYDAAFLVAEPLNGVTLADAVGASGIAFNQERGLDYRGYGYPAYMPFDGQTLWSCTGTGEPDETSATGSQGIPCDMTTGSSGGPWFIGSSSDGIQNSVVSYGYGPNPERMYGPYFGSVIESVYMEAQGEGQGQVEEQGQY